MAINRIEEFLDNLKSLTKVTDIKPLCNLELDYLRKVLDIKPVFSDDGYPYAVTGDARRLKTQVSAYRNAIKKLELNSKNSYSKIANGKKVKSHKALKFFNLTDYEKKDVSIRDNNRVTIDKTNRLSFDAVAVIKQSISLLDNKSYVDKVAGLYLLTGRRHEEILITGVFDNPDYILDENNLLIDWLENNISSCLFSGQVKRKGNSDIPYNIPILAPLDKIKNTVDWLRENVHHKPGQRAKGSKELGLKVRKFYQDNRLLPIPYGKNNYLNPHNLRSAYSAICWQLFKHSNNRLNCTEDIFVKSIMGHIESGTDSAQAYLDYELNNNDTKNLIQYFNN